ncbi:MAG: hypothetical protein KAJ19_10545 [Gammaproteobacteria bacterium]|nr:hypothetical protein [Gammaproteobacteria bacterium]
MRARELLTEAKNPHIAHLEDLVFDKGYAGAVESLKLASGVRNMLSKGRGKRGKVTVKFDGAPAIFAGIDPADGRFFVGGKAAFSKNPKMIKKPSDLKKFYEGAPEDFVNKMAIAYTELRKLGIKDVLQGDLMFVKDMLEQRTINNENYIVFTPNTITYAVEADSDLAKEIQRAKFGIVFHTAYIGGETLNDAEKTFDIDISKLNKTSDVWYDDAEYKDLTGIASLTLEEDEHLRQEIIAAKARLSELGKAELEKIVNNSEFKKTIQIFINANVRAGEHIKDSAEFTKEFLQFHKERTLQDVESLKSELAKQKRHQKVEAKKSFIEQNQNSVYKLIDLYNHLNEIKLILINKLNTIDGMKTFIRSGNGFEVTNPEGFVALGHSGDATKLVNRMEFSQQNFNK